MKSCQKNSHATQLSDLNGEANSAISQAKLGRAGSNTQPNGSLATFAVSQKHKASWPSGNGIYRIGRREDRGAGRHAARARPVHRLCPDQCRLHKAADGHGRQLAQAADEGEARRGSDLPRRPRQDLWDASNKGGGTAKFKTVEGEELTVEFKGQALTIRDTKGNASRVTIQNVFQSNGVIHVIDSVLMPSSWLTPGCSPWPSAHSASIGWSPSRPRGGLFVWVWNRWP